MLRLKVVQMLGQLTVHMVREHAHAREQGAQHGQLLLQQLHLLLQPVVFARQNFDALLCFAATHLGFFARFAHSHVVTFAAPAVFVRGLVAARLLLGQILWLLGKGLERGQRTAHAVGQGGGRAAPLVVVRGVVGEVGGGGDNTGGGVGGVGRAAGGGGLGAGAGELRL